MGVGKSTFARSVLRILVPDLLHIPSPSFPIMIAYAGPHGTIWHVDLYRIQHASELVPLGLEERIRTECCLIEWPERLGPCMPKQYASVSLDFVCNAVGYEPHKDSESSQWRRMTLTIAGKDGLGFLETEQTRCVE